MATGLPACGEFELLLPDIVYITPSNINPWRGLRRPASRYTEEQLARMRREGIDAATIADVVVRQKVGTREYWWPSCQPAPVYLMPCPIIGRRERSGDQQLKVISPSGDRKWVYADGSITRVRKPFRRRW